MSIRSTGCSRREELLRVAYEKLKESKVKIPVSLYFKSGFFYYWTWFWGWMSASVRTERGGDLGWMVGYSGFVVIYDLLFFSFLFCLFVCFAYLFVD